jgi:MoaA/NifB/PqqE/SkfB family radical SAM enzyme
MREENLIVDSAMISVADFCEVGCKFCFRADKGSASLNSRNLARILSRLVEIGVTKVCFTGGEPADHPDFVLFCKLAIQFGVLPSVVSSARSETQVGRIADAQRFLSSVTISADSSYVVKKFRSPRSILATGPIFSVLKGPDKYLHVVMRNLCALDLEQIAAVVRGKNIFLDVSPLVVANRKCQENSEVLLREFREDLLMLSSLAELSGTLKNFSKNERDGDCRAGGCFKRRIYVSAGGEARFCPYDVGGVVLLSESRKTINESLHKMLDDPSVQRTECLVVCR